MLVASFAPVRLSGNLFLSAPVVINPEHYKRSALCANPRRKKEKSLHLQLCPLARVIKWGHGPCTCSEASRGNLQASLRTFKHHQVSDERARKRDKCLHTKLKSTLRSSPNICLCQQPLSDVHKCSYNAVLLAEIQTRISNTHHIMTSEQLSLQTASTNLLCFVSRTQHIKF